MRLINDSVGSRRDWSAEALEQHAGLSELASMSERRAALARTLAQIILTTDRRNGAERVRRMTQAVSQTGREAPAQASISVLDAPSARVSTTPNRDRKKRSRWQRLWDRTKTGR